MNTNATTGPIVVSVGLFDSTSLPEMHWRCPECGAAYDTDRAAAVACCADKKTQNLRRAEQMVRVRNRKLAEVDRIDDALEAMGVELEYAD